MATEKQMQFTIKQGMNQDILKSYPDNHFDSIVTDPPYGIEFLGKDWDSNTGAIETWEECYRVLKPGGHMLAFSAARTYHHLATNIESVGFEIRDLLMWIYASGFPKAQDMGKAIQKRQGVQETKPYEWNAPVKGGRASTNDLGKGNFATGKDDIKVTSPEAQAWSGWKTALKPAHEPIVMARKPFKGSCIDNVLKHGTGALNIDATRIATDEVINCNAGSTTTHHGFNSENNVDGPGTGNKINPDQPKWQQAEQGRFPSNVFGEIPDYQKYFYCPKVSRAERHCGFETNNIPTSKGGMLDKPTDGSEWVLYQHKKEKGSLDHIPTDPGGMYDIDKGNYIGTKRQQANSVGNNHPTVKPVALMSYLVKLVTPEGGKVLDPFNGSGSTGMAAVEHGFDYTGCELDPAYVEIATKRINGWYNKTLPDNNFKELFNAIK